MHELHPESRRKAARWPVIALALLAVLLVFGQRSPARADDDEKVIHFYAQAYTPEITTGDNPSKLHQFTRIAHEWEALHPGVHIEFVKNPIGEYRTWMRTQLQAGMAPDLMWSHAVWSNEDAKYGWFVNLDPYLAQPNRYVKPGQPGHDRWWDTFYANQTNARRAPDGHLYSLPIDLVQTGIYYNKDLFAKAGVKPPRTWSEFIEAQKRLQAIGVVPFQMTGGEPMVFEWARSVLSDQLWADREKEIDVRTSGPGGYPGVDPQEFIRAYEKGLFSVRDPRYREFLRLMKQWSQFWQPGYLSEKNESNRLFRLGGAAMYWGGSWYAPQIERDPLRSFRYGIFLFPALTKQDSPYAGRKLARSPGGASSLQYAVTNTAVRNGTVELCVDFLRYMTAQQNLGPLVKEAGMFVPNAKGQGLEPSPLQKPFMPLLQRGQAENSAGAEQAGPEYEDQWFRVMQAYLGGQIGIDQTINQLDRYLAVGVKQTLHEHQREWRWGRDWSLLPAVTPTVSKPPTPPWHIFIALGAALLVFGGFAFTRPQVWRARNSYLFIAPTFAALILFSYYPIVSALSHSLAEWKGNGDSHWIGMANFLALFHDDTLRASIGNSLVLLGANMLITLTVPLAVAEAIFSLRSERAQYLYRVLFVIPMVVPGIVFLLIWGFFFDYNLGLLNELLQAVHLGAWKQAWLGDPRIALYSLIGIGFPWVGGFALLVYYAGLQGIPADVLDSARIDGARGLTRFWKVDLPLLAGQVRLLMVLAFIGGIQGFQTQLILTNGGPGYSTTVPGMHMYATAFTFDRMGYACAIGVALFIVTLGLTYLNLKFFRASSEYQPA